MSFMLTPSQILTRHKTVTRRLGWEKLQPGTIVRAVRKCQGLKKGEKIEQLALLRIVSVRREPLRAMLDNIEYGLAEVEREGLADHPSVQGSAHAFVEFFCNTHRPCEKDWTVTRIEFEYFEL